MQSVYKLHLAMAVLTQVDKGKLSLSQKIHVTKKDLLPDTWSPLRDEYPEGDAHIALYDILRYTVSQSDNNGCDILFRLLGGPEKVNAYIHNLGITQTAIVATEEDMHKKWDTQFANWSETDAIVQLLDIIFQRKLLSTTSSIVLWKFMTQTATGANRIRGMLPEGTTVAHKTGSSGTDEHGNTPATNDAGIIKLPNGKHIAIVVFVANAKADEATRDAAIAKISKATWDYFAAK
jgi:beta-lactamase class A